MESNGSENLVMKLSEKLIEMNLYDDGQITRFLTNNQFSEITVYLRDGKNKKEIIKSKGNVIKVDDDYDNVSFSDKFLEWMTVVAKK